MKFNFPKILFYISLFFLMVFAMVFTAKGDMLLGAFFISVAIGIMMFVEATEMVFGINLWD